MVSTTLRIANWISHSVNFYIVRILSFVWSQEPDLANKWKIWVSSSILSYSIVKFTIMLEVNYSDISILKLKILKWFMAENLFFTSTVLKKLNLEISIDSADERQLFLWTFQLLNGKMQAILLSLGNMLFLSRLNFLTGYLSAQVSQKTNRACSCKLNTCLLLK